MTAGKALKKAADILNAANIENAVNESRWIFEAVVENGRELIYFHPEKDIDEKVFLDKISERANGTPIQYVIGLWDFYGEAFEVGAGVLIPRPETEMLIEFAAENFRDKNITVVDLCSGSGCIGLTAARLLPNAKVYLVEKSPEAMKYLEKNLRAFDLENVTAVNGDAFKSPKENGIEKFDLLLSNPPYIETAEIETLQSEVLREPKMALDGGNDGLDFYRVIAEKWLPECRCAVCVECGEGQSREIEKLFSPYCTDTYSQPDMNGIERTVCGFIK